MRDENNQSLKDYGRFALYAIPCGVVIAFASIILMPRFEYLLELTSPEIIRPDGRMPSMLAALVATFEFFLNHFYVVVPPLLLVVVLMELRSRWWRSVRGKVFSVIRFALVTATLFAMVAMCSASLALLPILTEESGENRTQEQESAEAFHAVPPADIDDEP